MTLPSGPDAVLDLVRFLDASPTPYHAVEEVSLRLRRAGFRQLKLGEEWQIAPFDRVYVVQSGGTIVALAVGGAPPSEGGFRLIGAHTDSPNLRVKPHADILGSGHHQLAVEVYGSPLLHTWLDRDLALAGRVSLLDGTTHLIRIDRPICRISSLAIHLSPTLATDGLRLNPQQHLTPTLAIALGTDERPGLAELLVTELRKYDVEPVPEAIAAFDLALFDTQPASISSADGQLLASARLDNLASCHAALTALLDGEAGGPATRGIVLYDHEEVGSQSAAGASSLFLRSVLERVAESMLPGRPDAAPRAFARSFLVSADMAHAVHPNHADKHDREHAPKLGSGPVIKVNVSQSYATDAPGAAVFERVCRDAGFSAQRFVSRNDMRCGSTIGPISAARLGMRTVDVGNPMLSMHSCREVTATSDVVKMIRALAGVLALADVPPASA